MNRNMSDADLNKFFKESAKVAVDSSQNIASYKAVAGADDIISKKSTDEGLSDIIDKITGGFAGDANKGSDPGKPMHPGEAVDGQSVDNPSMSPNKGETIDGSEPMSPKSDVKTVPMEGNDFNFDPNESKILSKLIEEIERNEKSLLDEITTDESDDSTLELDESLEEMEDLTDDEMDDLDLEIYDLDID